MDAAKILANKAARAKANEWVDLLVHEVTRDKAINPDRFWEQLAEAAAAKIGRVLAEDGPHAEAMGLDDALKFEKETVPYGNHKGKQVRDVDPEYWILLVEADFQKKLRRYVKSLRFMQIQGR